MSAGKEYTKKELKEYISDYTAVTVPINVTFDGKQKILSMPQVERILRASRIIATYPSTAKEGTCDQN